MWAAARSSESTLTICCSLKRRRKRCETSTRKNRSLRLQDADLAAKVLLHALLDRREQELIELQAEVEDLRGLVKQADRTAIHATAELYNVTPEQLAEIMKSMFGDRLVPELPKDVQAVPAETDAPAKLPDEEVMDDDA